MKHKTTREFYEKYDTMAKRAGVTLIDSYLSKRDFYCYYKTDIHLNNVPGLFRELDGYYGLGRIMHPDVWPKTLSENACMYKHLIYYELLKLEPEFEEEQ